MTRLRVLHVTRDFPPRSRGGLSTAVGGLVEAQARADMECAVVSFDDYRPRAGGRAEPEPEESHSESGIPIVRVASAQALPRAREIALAFASDIVHVHDGRLWDFGAEIARAQELPSVFTTHVMPSEQDRLRGIDATHSSLAQSKALSECDRIHAPSQCVATLLGQSAAHKTRIIPLASAPWPHAASASQAERTGRPGLLLYVGRFADINGFAELLSALPPLFDQHPELQAIAAGGLPGNERSARRWQKRWEEMAGPHDSRLQMPGWLSRDQLSTLYGQATMLVVPSWFETFAQVVLEGMLHGTPLITTGAGAIAELVDHESALLIEARDAAAITRAADAILRDPASAEKRRMVALRRAQGYDWESRIPLFRELYEAMVT